MAAEKYRIAGNNRGITVPYLLGDNWVNTKHRMFRTERGETDFKAGHAMDEGQPLIMWNIDACVGQETIAITEIDPHHTGDASAETVLSADDYRVLHGGHTIERLAGGTNGREYWAPLTKVTYTPSDVNSAARDEATIRLMALDLSERGLLKSERAGDYSYTLGDAKAEREKILASLAARSGMVLA